MSKLGLILIAALAFSASGAYAQVPPENGAGSGTASSWVAGIHGGHNWQNGSVVYGIETDLSGTALKTDFSTVLHGVFLTSPVGNTNSNIEYYGTVRGRLGWAAGQWLFYGTGGLAYGSLDVNSMFQSPIQLALQTNELRIGWVGGAGIEYKWSPNVIFSLNYQYVDLGRVNFSTVATGPFPPSITGSDHAQLQAVTFGVSWLFSPDGKGPHGIWEGNYIGGHVGGDWGNETNASYSVPVAP